MFSIMDFLPTFAHIVGGKMPTDRAIDGVDQIDVLLGSTAIGHRESLLSFIGADLVAARWKQWRICALRRGDNRAPNFRVELRLVSIEDMSMPVG
jgi:hypothetical protein